MADHLAHLDMLPEHMREGVRLYIEKGILPGDFLQAVLRHELFEAVGRADLINQHALINYVKYFYNHAPSGCHGNNGKVDGWIAHRGLEGLYEDA